jgi:hypothetical protein
VPTPNPEACAGACLQYACGTPGVCREVTVTGVVDGQVWGTGPYTADSSVGSAAVHAGLLSKGEEKRVGICCADRRATFEGGTANGVTTQAYVGLWDAFTFDVSGATPEPKSATPSRCWHDPCMLNKCTVQGTTQRLLVTGKAAGNLWGSNPFTDDSDLGLAAVFLGLGAAGDEISVVATCTGAQEAFTGGPGAGGVTSASYGYWQFSYRLAAGVPVPTQSSAVVCGGDCLNGACAAGHTFRLRVRGSTFGYLWGTNSYTDDSSVPAAAVHAGVLGADQEAELTITCEGERASFDGSFSNGVLSKAYGAWPRAFSMALAPPAPAPEQCSGACLVNQCHAVGEVRYVAVVGSASGAIWGTSIYSDDSPVGTAAAHAGLVAVGEAKNLVATCTGPQQTFEGTAGANGVTSQQYGAWARSYTLE